MARLTHSDADAQIESAMGAPSSSTMDAFQKFLSNRGVGNMPRSGAGIPTLPKEQIKKLPLKTQ